MENTQQSQSKKIQIKDGFAGGEYTNVAQISHTKDEFLLTFLNIVPPSGRVVGKMITSPGHLKRIAKALEENIKKYEAVYGPIETAEPPQEIGFQDK